MSQPSRPQGPVVVLAGPTAAGKSALAIELAERHDGEVINADSMQVYRYMDIGTGKPSPSERARVPHHLFDVVTPKEIYDAARFARESRRHAGEIHGRRRPVFLAGGTGLYVRAFLGGLVPGVPADPEFRQGLEAEHAAALAADDADRLHRRLQEEDAAAAERIHRNDIRRVIRALELARDTDQRSSRMRDAHGFSDRPYRVLHLALDPGVAVVDERIDARCRAMIDGGLLQEVRELRERGYGPELRPMQAIGYRHVQPVADGSDTLVNALAAMQRDTRRFARRQRTWLRAEPEVVWLDPRERETIHARVDAFLAA